ncbi:stage V sporulation protein AA [Lachnospiraceae bacterium 42-17]|jgi:stage V sporulation protein AA
MASNSETVYIKADRNVEVTKPQVTLGDVLKMECANVEMLPKLKTIKLLTFHHTDKKNQNRTAVSILRVIELIHEQYPNIDIQNMGEQDFIVTYEEQKTAGGVLHTVKAVVVVLISFIGAAFSIMAFNNDVDVTKMFGQIYELITGTESNGFTMLELTYSIGLVIGILTFFNHFGKKRFSVDPTPMEVEMRLYENDLQTTLIENISRKGKELDVGKRNTSGSHRT